MMPVEPDSGRSAAYRIGVAISMARVFWIVACADIVVILAAIVMIRADPMPYAALFELLLLGLLGVLGAITVVVAFFRNDAAHGIGLALLVCPQLYFGEVVLGGLKDAALRAVH